MIALIYLWHYSCKEAGLCLLCVCWIAVHCAVHVMGGSLSPGKGGGHYTTTLPRYCTGEIAAPGSLCRGNFNNHFLPGGVFAVGTWERMLLTQLKSHSFFFFFGPFLNYHANFPPFLLWLTVQRQPTGKGLSLKIRKGLAEMNYKIIHTQQPCGPSWVMEHIKTFPLCLTRIQRGKGQMEDLTWLVPLAFPRSVWHRWYFCPQK